MVVCQYFQRGHCRFGDHCRNEHPGNPRGGGGFGNQSWSNSAPATGRAAVLPFTQDSIRSDLTVDKPLWPLSTYGPAKSEPNLITGLDESSEELRVHAVLALKAGNMNEYTAYESNKIQAANQAYDIARNNLQQAHQTASNQSPHSTKPTPTAFASTSTAAPTTTTTSAFGQTGFGSTAPSAFGQPSQPPQSVFGQPTQPPQSAFGSLKPAATITTGGSVFGQSSFGQPQQQSQSVFGQTSGPSSSSPSSMIKPASGAFSAFAGNATSSPFAAAAAAANQNQSQNQGSGGGGGFSAFAGQPSAFGTSSGSAFGQPSGAAPVSAFGQTQQQPTSAFGGLQTQPTSAFGGGGGGFGSFGTTPTQPQSAFGNLQTTQPVQSAFGQQPQTQPQSVFGSGGAFGGGNTNVNPLNPLNAAPTSSSVFTPLSNQSNPLNAGGLTQSPFGATTNPLNPPQPQPTSAYSSMNHQQQNPFTNTTNFLTTGTTINPITNPNTRPDFSRIFEMVKGKYKPGVTPYDALLPPNYAGLLPETATEAFQGLKFEFGKVPDWVPPVEFR